MPYVYIPNGLGFTKPLWISNEFEDTFYYPGIGVITYQDYVDMVNFQLGVANNWDPFGLNGATITSQAISDPPPPTTNISPSTDIKLVPPPPMPITLSVVVREGIRVSSGEFRAKTTGPLKPSTVTGSGWTDAQAALSDDDVYASHSSTSAPSYTSVLVAKGFDFSSIPDGAQITGIKVTVRRRRI